MCVSYAFGNVWQLLHYLQHVQNFCVFCIFLHYCFRCHCTKQVDLTLDDFQRISAKTPVLADLKPSGRYVMADLQQYGGTPAVLRYLLDHGLIDGSCLTVTGATMAENLANIAPIPPGNPIIYPLEQPLKASGHIQILYGNVSPGGAVAKISGKEGIRFTGRAKVFDSEESMMQGLARKEIQPGKIDLILLY